MFLFYKIEWEKTLFSLYIRRKEGKVQNFILRNILSFLLTLSCTSISWVQTTITYNSTIHSGLIMDRKGFEVFQIVVTDDGLAFAVEKLSMIYNDQGLYFFLWRRATVSNGEGIWSIILFGVVWEIFLRRTPGHGAGPPVFGKRRHHDTESSGPVGHKAKLI